MPERAKDRRLDPLPLRAPAPAVVSPAQPQPQPQSSQRRPVSAQGMIQPPPDSASAREAADALMHGRNLTDTGALARARDKAKTAAGRHSRLVRVAKFALPVIGIVVAGLVFGRMWLFSHLPGLNMPAVLFTKNGLTMVEPRLTGRSRDRAYDISAAKAMQDFLTPKVVQLEQLAGRVEMPDNAWAKIESRTGTYDGTNDGLKLAGAVSVTTSTGYHLKAQDADIDLTKGNMVTSNPVHIEGPTGWLDAGAAEVTESGARVAFSKGVRMTINPAVVPTTTPSDQPTAPGNTP